MTQDLTISAGYAGLFAVSFLAATVLPVASEVARTLLGSLGLLAAVPVTTALAALAARRPPSGSTGA